MNWLKKKLNQIVDKLNNDDAGETQFAEIKKNEAAAIPTDRFDNIEEFKEISSGVVIDIVRLLGYSNTRVAQIIFYTSLSENAVESQALKLIATDNDFLKDLKRAFRNKNVAYTDDVLVKVIYNVADINKFTKINDLIGVEVLTPQESGKRIKASLKALQGMLWQDEYVIEPREMPYFIGRCKTPKLASGNTVKNDIAFIGLEELNEEIYKINSNVSRSHAVIMYDDNIGSFVVYRSKELKNPAQKLRVASSKKYNDEGVSIHQSTIPYILKDGDVIYFNEAVSLMFNIVTD